MKITCKQQDLSKGLSIVSHAVSSRSTLPILANVLLVTENGRLKLSATNLEIGVTCWVDAEIIEEGTTTSPAKLLTDLVSSLPPSSVEIEVGGRSLKFLSHTDEPTPSAPDDFTLYIKSQRSSASIKGMDPAEYPTIPSVEDSETPILIDAALLKEIIGEVSFAAAEDDSRPVLTGVFVEIKNEKATFAAADAFRVAMRVVDLPGVENQEPLLIPAKTLEELARVLPANGSVQMVVTPNRSQVLFHTEQIDLVSRLIEGTFPNFRGVFPKDHTTCAVVETKEFAAAVKSVVPFARDSSNIVRIKVEHGEEESTGTMTLESSTEDFGSNVVTVPVKMDGFDIQIIFNVKYVSDILNAVSTPEVVMELSTSSRPGVVKPAGDDALMYVIMPMSRNS